MPKKKETIEDILDRIEEDIQKVRDYVWDQESDDQVEDDQDDFEDDDDLEDDDE
jgi:hypothetical protein